MRAASLLLTASDGLNFGDTQPCPLPSARDHARHTKREIKFLPGGVPSVIVSFTAHAPACIAKRLCFSASVWVGSFSKRFSRYIWHERSQCNLAQNFEATIASEGINGFLVEIRDWYARDFRGSRVRLEEVPSNSQKRGSPGLVRAVPRSSSGICYQGLGKEERCCKSGGISGNFGDAGSDLGAVRGGQYENCFTLSANSRMGI